VLAGLLDEPPARGSGRGAAPAPPRRRKIAWSCTYPVYPPEHGGALRVYHVARELGRRFDVELVTLAHAESKPFAAEIAPGVREVRVPRSHAQQQAEWEIEQQVGVPAQDLALLDPTKATPEYLGALEAAAHDAALVGCGPYLLAAVRAAADKPLWYDSHNVEADLKHAMFRDTATARRFLAAVADAERACCREARFATVCSEEDRQRLAALYGAEPQRLVVVPNGVDVPAIRFTPPPARAAARGCLGLDAACLALFIGSWHEPNIRAVRHVFAMARELPEVAFLVAGGCGTAVAKEERPANVALLGPIDGVLKGLLLEVADVALNPMTSGSGTNLKMLEYFAAGTPVISTPFGTRGQWIEPGTHCVVCALEEFPAAVRALRAEDPEAKARRCASARAHVELRFDWSVVVRAFPESW
jgi:glycosyltransferase involved in cell wall biosynthesis